MFYLLNDNQKTKLNDWVKKQNPLAILIQQNTFDIYSPLWDIAKSCWDYGYPYSGASGGMLTYSFTETSLDTVVVVKHNITDQEIDLTEYENW